MQVAERTLTEVWEKECSISERSLSPVLKFRLFFPQNRFTNSPSRCHNASAHKTSALADVCGKSLRTCEDGKISWLRIPCPVVDSFSSALAQLPPRPSEKVSCSLASSPP